MRTCDECQRQCRVVIQGERVKLCRDCAYLFAEREPSPRPSQPGLGPYWWWQDTYPTKPVSEITREMGYTSFPKGAFRDLVVND